MLIQKQSWLTKRGFAQGVLWTLAGCLLSNINDILMKYTGSSLNPFQIVFFRSFLGLIIVTPIFLLKRKKVTPPNFKTHSKRVIVGAAAIILACYSTTILPLPEVTALSFCQPLFFLPAAVFFLKEKLTIPRILGNFIGCIGIFIILDFKNCGFFSLTCLVPLMSAFLFTMLDIITKKNVDFEDPLNMIFYFNLGVTIISGILTLFAWQNFSFIDFCLLFLLGISATLIQLSCLLSLSASSILSVAPVRYAEILFSCFFSIYLFNEAPTYSVIFGSLLVVSGIFFTSYYESKKINERI